MKDHFISSERLYLTPLTEENAKEVFSYRSDKATNAYQSWIPEQLVEVKKWISKLDQHKFNTHGTWSQFGILELRTNKLVGDLGIHFIGSENRQIELGCTLNKLYHGKGYATEIMYAVISYLFSELNKHRIMASIDPANKASIALVERLGFRKEGRFIKSYFFKGEYVDDIIYAILSEEWIQNRNQNP